MIFDTGSSHIFIPRTYFKDVVYEMLRQAGSPDFVIFGSLVFSECNANWQPVRFMFKNYWIKVEPKDYLQDLDGNGEYCMLLFAGSLFAMFGIFGQPIFQ